MTEYETSFPFDAIEDVLGEFDKIYSAEDFADYFAQFLADGIYPNPSTNLQVQSLHNNMILTVGKGSALIKGYGYINKERMEVTVSTANAAYHRIDTIVVQLSMVEREIKVLYKEGVPSASPGKPPLIRNDDVYELQLAQVLVRSGRTYIDTADVTDTRLDARVCGIVSAVVESVDTTTLFQQYETYLSTKMAEWNTTKQSQATAFNTQMAGQRTSFTTQLSGQDEEFDGLAGEFNTWFADVNANLASLQSFYYQNWLELKGCVYKDNPKNAQGQFMSTITVMGSNKLVARQTEWTEGAGSAKAYYTKIEVFKEDGVTMAKTATRKDYKNAEGVWIGEVV